MVNALRQEKPIVSLTRNRTECFLESFDSGSI